MDAPKDFEIGRICIEAKARRGAAAPHVAISSEHQLDTEGVDFLFLHVSEITEGSDTDEATVTVTEMARAILEEIRTKDAAGMELFEQRLAAAGFEWSHDYSDRRWLAGPEHLYEVREGFPRVTASQAPAGVRNIRYSVSLPDCEPFRTDRGCLEKLITGGTGGGQH